MLNYTTILVKLNFKTNKVIVVQAMTNGSLDNWNNFLKYF
jgi:hypothetical protein